MSLVLSILLTALSAPSALADYFDRPAIEAWLNSDIPRGNGFAVHNAFPAGNRIKFCAGAGCKIKMPFEFSEAAIRAAAEAMEQARRERHCVEDSALCERVALPYALRSLDKTVRDSKLRGLSLEEAVRFSINKENGNNPGFFGDKLSQGQWLLRDCVDQAANGSAYLVVLANNKLLKHHRVVAPGQLKGLFPHFFTQVRELEGGKHLFEMDMYREPRTDFDKLAHVGPRD